MDQQWDVENLEAEGSVGTSRERGGGGVEGETDTVWEAISSDEEESSAADSYEAAAAAAAVENNNQGDVEMVGESFALEFPHKDLTLIVEGLEKWPWVVYPGELANCLRFAARLSSSLGMEESSLDFRRLQVLYRNVIPSAFDKCLNDKAIWKWKSEVQQDIFNSILRLIDLVVAKLSLAVDDLLPLLRTVSLCFDKQCQYHLKHKDLPRLPGRLVQVYKFTRPLPGPGEWHCLNRKALVKEAEGCQCSRCKVKDVYSVLAYFLNYFGQTPYGNGYQRLVALLSLPVQLSPVLLEAALQLMSRAAEFLTDEVAEGLLPSCQSILNFIAEQIEKDVDALSDNGSFVVLSMILKHLHILILRGSSAENAESLVSAVQRRMVKQMLGNESFNKQLGAAREINKLFENAQAISLRDNSQSISSTIEWLEKNDILRHVLRSHLHHKQYIDQVQKILRFLLQEQRLSEEQLDNIWAFTEKPDQFEMVKSNIFDLIADLAGSFSAQQLDSLFKRFEHSQGRSTADTMKILHLVKRLAWSDTKGVMASRLLDFLWNELSGGTAEEIVESGVLTEILGHYESKNCANKDIYISRCLTNVAEGKFVIPSLRLLRDFIWLVNDRQIYQDEISRKTCLHQLVRDHNLFLKIVTSLEDYIESARASTRLFQTLTGLDCQYSHDEHVKERLDFLLCALQVGGGSLSWDVTNRIWRCLIESPAQNIDKERGFQLFYEVLDKWQALSMEGQINLLIRKFPDLDPLSLSPNAWRCFLQLFILVNRSVEKLKKSRSGDILVTQDLDLLGLSYLWEIAFSSCNEIVTDQSINMLGDIYTCLSNDLHADIKGIRQIFIDKCIGHLSKVFNRVDGRLSQSSGEGCYVASCCTGADRNQGDEESLGLAKPKELNLLGGKTVSPSDRGYELERCLKVIKMFVLKCEERCTRSIPAHTAFYQGRHFILGVTIANKNVARFDLMVHANEYLSSLRAKVAKHVDQSLSRVRLLYMNRELIQDSQVLWQCGISAGSTISVSISAFPQVDILEPFVKHSDDEYLPGILMSKNMKVYEMLFKLENSSDSNVREEAKSMLLLLPTHPVILANLKSLEKKPFDGAQTNLASFFGAQMNLLYTLQILDGLIVPANKCVDSQFSLNFRKMFLRLGGFRYLQSVLEPGALSEGIDNQTRRGCYAIVLHLLKYLVLNKDAHKESALIRRDESMSVKDDETIGSDQIESYSEEKSKGAKLDNAYLSDYNKQCLKEKHEGINSEALIGVLKRLTWTAGIGQLSAMGTTSNVSVFAKTEGKSRKKRSFPDDDESCLHLDDQFLCLEAFDFLVFCLVKDVKLSKSFFTSPDIESFISAMVLYSPDDFVRYSSAVNFLKLSAIRIESGEKLYSVRQLIVVAMINGKNEASQLPKRCLQFWELLGQLFYNIEGPTEESLARQQLEEELQWLESAPATIDEDDKVLEGHLYLLKMLVAVLNKRVIGSSRNPEGRCLVQMLIKQFLFPESILLWNSKIAAMNGKSTAADVSIGAMGYPVEHEGLVQAKCGTRGSRERAFDLLLCLSTHCIESFEETVELLMRIHFSDQVLGWDYIPSYGRKAVGGYVGLKNAGATCYMNSVFQQLFMQPEVRHAILGCTEIGDIEKQGSMFFQLQAIFGALLGSSLDHYKPEGFWCAFRDCNGRPINLWEHQDAFEFFNRLYEAVDETLKSTRQLNTLTRIFGGVFVQQIICHGCPHRSEMEELFPAISVDVKNKKGLLESLDAVVSGDLLEGDNAYYCEECGKKVDALKRVCVKSLPRTLVIHLKRFDFDYETMQRLKLKDRFEFPLHLDMKPYTVEGLAFRESESQANNSPSGLSKISLDTSSKEEDCAPKPAIKSDSYYNYDLVGVVVHTGSAFMGHYYSYIKQRPWDHPLSSGSGGWIVFDDKQVEPYDLRDLEKDCFGGKCTADVNDNFLKTPTPQELDRPNSAYMLFYERSEPEALPIQSLSQLVPSLIKENTAKDDGDGLMRKNQTYSTASLDVSLKMPISIRKSILEENLRFVHENYRLDRSYFQFLLRLVSANSDLIGVKISRSGSCWSEDLDEHEKMGMRRAHAIQNIQKETVDETVSKEWARLIVIIITQFLFKIYLRLDSSLQEDLPEWKVEISKILVESKLGCRLFIEALVQQPLLLEEYLRSPVDDVRQLFMDMLVQAMSVAIHFCQQNQVVNTSENELVTSHLDTLVDVLICMLRDSINAKDSCHQLFQVLLEYAKIGTTQCQQLINKSIIPYLVAYGVNLTRKVNISAAQLEMACLFSLLSFVLRRCDVSTLHNTPLMLSTKQLSEGDVKEYQKILSKENPFQHPPPLFPFPRDAINLVFKQRTYISLLIETCPQNHEVVEQLQFCCWENHSFSMLLLQDIMRLLIQRAVHGAVGPLLALVYHILLLDDSLQKWRQELFLLGNESSQPGLLNHMMAKALSEHWRYRLMKFMVKLASACPGIKSFLANRRVEWGQAVDWLVEELEEVGSPVPATASNDDSSNGHLRRTTSAEWTLVNAKGLFSI